MSENRILQRPLTSWSAHFKDLCQDHLSGKEAESALREIFCRKLTLPQALCKPEHESLCLLLELSHELLWGSGQAVLDRLDAFEAKKQSTGALPAWLQDEFLYLKLAATRIKLGAEAFERLYRKRKLATGELEPEYAERIELKLSFEYACMLLNQGQCTKTMEQLVQVLGADECLDLCTEMNALAAMIINCVNAGQQRRALQYLAELSSMGHLSALQIEKRSDATELEPKRGRRKKSDFALAQYRYVSLICAEGSRVFPEATLLKAITQQGTQSSWNQQNKYDALCEQSLVRVYLRSGAILHAERALRKVEHRMQKISISSDILNFAEERLELALIKKEMDSSHIKLAHQLIRSAMRRRDFRSEMRLRTFLGAALIQDKQFSEAQKQLDKAASIGARQGLSADLIETYFHFAGLFSALKLKSKALGYLDLCLRLARDTEASSLAAILSYLIHVFDTKALSPKVLEKLFSEGENAFASYYLEHYDFLKDLYFQCGKQGVYLSYSEKALRELLKGAAGVFYFQDHPSLFVSLGEEKFQIHAVPSAKDFEVLFNLLFESKQSYSLAEMHMKRNPQSRGFDSYRHSPALRSFITRLRQDLVGAPLSLSYDPIAKSYHMHSQLPLYFIQAKAIKKHQNDSRKLTRIDFVKEYARQNEVFRVADLCRELRVTRQALHSVLKQLVDSGEISLVRKGVRSFYSNQSSVHK